jgi:hypothetical protein
MDRPSVENPSRPVLDASIDASSTYSSARALPVAEVAARIGLSTTTCWRRIQALERRVIRGQVAVLDRAALGLDVTIFAHQSSTQGRDAIAAFAGRSASDRCSTATPRWASGTSCCAS